MPLCDTFIWNTHIIDGSGDKPQAGDITIDNGHICTVGQIPEYTARQVIDDKGSVLAPVHKMTGMPTTRFGLTDRGLIKKRYCTDLALFNAEMGKDTATFTSPISPAEDIDIVWVNRMLCFCGRTPTGQQGGRFLPRLPLQI